jgi:hypothetical protein
MRGPPILSTAALRKDKPDAASAAAVSSSSSSSAVGPHHKDGAAEAEGSGKDSAYSSYLGFRLLPAHLTYESFVGPAAPAPASEQALPLASASSSSSLAGAPGSMGFGVGSAGFPLGGAGFPLGGAGFPLPGGPAAGGAGRGFVGGGLKLEDAIAAASLRGAPAADGPCIICGLQPKPLLGSPLGSPLGPDRAVAGDWVRVPDLLAKPFDDAL